MLSRPPPLDIVRHWLQNELSVLQSRQTNVYVPRLPEELIPKARHRPDPTVGDVWVTLDINGSAEAASYDLIWTPRIVCRTVAVGQKYDHEMWSTHLAIQQIMRDLERTTVRIGTTAGILYNATLTAGPSPGNDPDYNWPFILSTYGIRMNREPI